MSCKLSCIFSPCKLISLKAYNGMHGNGGGGVRGGTKAGKHRSTPPAGLQARAELPAAAAGLGQVAPLSPPCPLPPVARHAYGQRKFREATPLTSIPI